MPKKKQNDPLKAKAKKQKIIAGVGGVIFLGLMGIQVPKVLKQMHRDTGPPPVPAAVSTPAVGSPTPSLAAPTLRGEQQASASSTPSTGSLAANTSTGVTQSQLESFSRFASKDPFSQQVDAAATSEPDSGGSSRAAAAPTRSASSGTTPTSGSGGGFPGGSGETTSGGSSGGTQPTPTSAVISVNGVVSSVTTGSDFPQASPLFHLVSLTATTAKISIVGGSYATGAPTITLRVNKPVTLQNTADGTRYKLVLKPQGTAVPASAPPAATPGTVTVPAPTSP